MKKILLIPLLFCWATFTSNAQITVTNSSYSLTSIDQRIDTLPLVSIGPGSAGANQTYDFSALNAHLMEYNTYIPPWSGTLGSQYPMATTCMRSDTLDFYFDRNANKLDFWGVAGNLLGNSPAVNRAMVYSNPQTIITFPATYNTTFVDTANYDAKYAYNALYNGYYVDSLREKERIITNSLVDGWGMVLTPQYTVGGVSCLRQNITKNSVDSIWAKVVVGNFHYWLLISSGNTNTPSYAYISDTWGPVVDIEYYTGTTTIYRITWNAGPNSISSNENGNNLSLFPNPNAGEFDMTLNADANKDYTIQISNVLGQIVYSEAINNINGEYTKHFDLSSYGEGIYIVNLFDNSGLVKSTKISITQ